ncbi:MAG TPA: hypothetical protein VFF31_14290 [Blastocatellia bacterium]|nr:hypothetical protein [Blastocatellia bacterium]
MTDETMQTRDGERGAALIMALLTLALLLALTMGMSLTAISELGVSSTYGTQTVALEAAEAGLNHAASLVSNYNGVDFTALLALRSLPLNTDYMSGNNPFVTANAGSFATGAVMINPEDANRGFQLRDGVTGALVPDVYYRVSLIDDEPTASTAVVKVPNFNPAGYSESTGVNANSATVDKNNRLVLYSTGTYANASVTLEGWIAFLPFPALSANDNIEISGSASITGSYGGVHSNDNIVENGNGWWVEQTVTASGTLTGDFAGQVGGYYGGNQPPLDLPPFVTRDPLVAGDPYTAPRLQDFLIRRADTLLIDPEFADGAHSTNENDGGSPTTRQLKTLANRLNIDYALLAAQLDSDTSSGNTVQQSAPIAISITRSVSGNYNSPGIPTKLANTTDVGWEHSADTWGIVGASAGGHTIYAVGKNGYDTTNQNLNSAGASTANGGNILLNGNVGGAGAPLAVTMFTTGSIEVRGNVNITSNLLDLPTPFLPPFVTPDILMMAVEDIWVNGDFAANIAFTGVSYAGEAVMLSGSGSINGQMIAFNWPHVDESPIDELNVVTGSFQLTLNNGDSIGRVKLYSWRQIKK